MSVRKGIYRILLFVWCFCWCCIWTGNKTFAATGLSSPSNASLVDEDGNLLDGEVINDLGSTGDINITNVTTDMRRTNAELASISNALSLLSRTVNQSAAGNVSTSVAGIFDRVVDGISPFDNYVLIRESEYGYRLYYGDIELSGSTFTGTAKSVYYYTGSYNQNSYMSFQDSEDDISISVGTYLTYSSLGVYPRLGSVSDEEMAFHLCVFVGFITFLVWSIFRICLFSFRK